MLKKFTTLLCVGALSIAFVGCEEAGEKAMDAADGAADAAGETMKDTMEIGAEAAKDGIDTATEAVAGE